MTAPNEARLQLFKRVAERLQQHDFKGWFYGDSVGFEGLLAAGDLIGCRTWQDFSHGFFRAWATRREPWQPDDNTAPGHVMCEIVARTGDEVLQGPCWRWPSIFMRGAACAVPPSPSRTRWAPCASPMAARRSMRTRRR